MVIGKVIVTNSFYSTTDYVLRQEQSEIIAGNMTGQTIGELVREFGISRGINPDLQHPCYHCPISISPRDENLSHEQIERISERYIAGMVVSDRNPELLKQEDKAPYKQAVDQFLEDGELNRYQWFTAEHYHQKERHIHIVWSRIDQETGNAVGSWQDRIRSQRILREIEKEEGLEQVLCSWEVGRKAITRRQQETWDQTGKPPARVIAQNAVDEVGQPDISFAQFQTELAQRGVTCELVYRQNKPVGVKYEADGVWMRGADLGSNYSLPGLKRRGIYQQEQEQQPQQIAQQPIAPAESPRLEERKGWDKLRQIFSFEPDRAEIQTGYVGQIAPQLQEIWNREAAQQPEIQAVSFEDYQIRLNHHQRPELYCRDRLVLGYAAEMPKSYGLSEQDCLMVQQAAELSRQQEQERLKQAKPQKTIDQSRSQERGGFEMD
ncbi:relaxase/mobilization nuclease domain-containing protein [Leptolyngbya sp. GB1-A1]|uniref:relaxase/mobilization nuclease domain-containing protein n=1 Tax=Leptolyngbya sp. GB1-A1 TaxID=2933908 RepID=UPI003299FC33